MSEVALLPNATVLRQIVREGGRRAIDIMSDGTFWVYHPEFRAERGIDHIAVGIIGDRDDRQIEAKASHFIFGSGVIWHHRDGTTPHDTRHPSRRKYLPVFD